MKRFFITFILLFTILPCFGQWECEYKQADPMYDQEAAYLFSYLDTQLGAMILFHDSNCSSSTVGIYCPEIVDYYIEYIRTSKLKLVTVRVGYYENNKLITKDDIIGLVGNNTHIVLFTESDSANIKRWLLGRGSVRFIIPQFLETNLDFTVPKYNGGKPIYE